MGMGHDDIGAAPTRPNVILTGFMATGKSTVGRVLAGRLRYGFVDTDRIIEERHGPIPVIFAEQGEAAFRLIERALAEELAGLSSLVISTGGGMLLDPAVADVMASSGIVVCLTAEPEVILRRVGGARAGERRPLLAGGDPLDRIVQLLGERAAAYARFPQVATDGRTPTEISSAIEDVLHGGSAG
ncbi:MAG: shikimate kinase [Ilumatobacteraceae bacterium]